MAAQNSELILITGGNGFVAAAVALRALQDGFRVRSAVRRQEAADYVKNAPALKPYAANGSLSLVIVPDITQPDSFVEAAKGCSFIVHTATPLPLKDFGDLVPAAVGGTRAVLEAAEANPSVQRVIITSSIYALRTFEEILPTHPHNQAAMAGDFSNVPPVTVDTAVPNQAQSQVGDAPMQRYGSAKIAARNEAINFCKERSPRFGIIHLLPGYILGPTILCQSKAEWYLSTPAILSFLLHPLPTGAYYGYPPEQDAPLAAWTCHIDDAAEAHVLAMKKPDLFQPGQPQIREFIMCSDGPHGPVWNDAVQAVKEELPDSITSQIPFAGSLDTIPSVFDSTPVEKEILGRKLTPFAKQVKDTMIDWYRLPQGEQALDNNGTV